MARPRRAAVAPARPATARLDRERAVPPAARAILAAPAPAHYSRGRRWPTSPGTLPPSPPRHRSPAAREQAALRDALAATLAGRGSLVLIGGEAGIGKAAPAEALLAEAEAWGALALVGRRCDLRVSGCGGVRRGGA